MPKTLSDRSGSSAFQSPAYGRLRLALLLAGAGFVAALLVMFAYPALRARIVGGGSDGFFGVGGGDAALAVVDIVIVNLPLALATGAAGYLAARVGVARATGIHSFKAIDLLWGVSLALLVRGIVEAVAPTTGSFGGPLGAPDPLVTAIAIVGIVLVSPFIEEWFFRGLVLRALVDALAGTRGEGVGPWLAGGIAVIVSTVAFAALHFVSLGGAVPLSLLIGTVGVGLACGVVTVVTGRLTAAIIAHVMFNAMGVFLLL